MAAKTTRELIFDTIDDAVGRLIYYGRREDEDLPLGAIERAVASGEVTVDEMVEQFATRLRGSILNRIPG